MTNEEKLERLVAFCKSEVAVTYNAHTVNYQSVSEYFRTNHEMFDHDVPPLLDAMVGADRIVDVQFYPDTPIGSYTVYGPDLTSALDQAMAILDDLEPRRLARCAY
jgi:hypothetical protein